MRSAAAMTFAAVVGTAEADAEDDVRVEGEEIAGEVAAAAADVEVVVAAAAAAAATNGVEGT